MAIEQTPTSAINIARICQVLAITDRGFNNALKGGQLDERLPIMLYNERKAVEWANTANPSDPTLQGMANYLYALCYPYAPKAQQIINNIAAGPPILTGPANQSGSVGFNAVFSVTVISATTTIFQWFQNGVAIPGATTASLTIFNAQLSQSGSTFFVVATNAAGSTVSGTATLTVSNALVGSFYQGSTDYSTLLLGGTDSVAYLGTFPITTGQPLNVTFPHLVSTEFIVVRYPGTETTKTNYLNPPPSGPDAGSIPSLALEGTSFGGFKYIFSRPGITFGLNNINGTVRFS